MMALANLAGGAGAYLALAHAPDAAEVVVHQAVTERTLRLRREREEALQKNLAIAIGNAVGQVMAKVFG